MRTVDVSGMLRKHKSRRQARLQEQLVARLQLRDRLPRARLKLRLRVKALLGSLIKRLHFDSTI